MKKTDSAMIRQTKFEQKENDTIIQLIDVGLEFIKLDMSDIPTTSRIILETSKTFNLTIQDATKKVIKDLMEIKNISEEEAEKQVIFITKNFCRVKGICKILDIQYDNVGFIEYEYETKKPGSKGAAKRKLDDNGKPIIKTQETRSLTIQEIRRKLNQLKNIRIKTQIADY